LVRESKREFKKKRIENSGGRRERERILVRETKREKERKELKTAPGGVALLCFVVASLLHYFISWLLL